MEENRAEEISNSEGPQLDLTNVTFLAGRQPRHHEPPASDDELAEYRRIRPLLLQMLAEWQTLKGPNGCPVARSLLTSD
jgi:hypothetical protein